MAPPSSSWRQTASDSADAGQPLPTEEDFTLEVRLTRSDGDDQAYHLIVSSNGYRYEDGPALSPTTTLTMRREVASALQAGETAVATAVQSGLIRVGGDPTSLLRHQAALAAVVARLAGAGVDDRGSP